MFAVLYLFAVVPVADQPTAAKKAAAKLQDTWLVVRAEELGHETGPEEAKKEQEEFVFTDGSVVVRRKSKVRGEFAITLHPGDKEGHIDFQHKAGKYAGQTCQALYSLQGDTLTICRASKLRSDREEARPFSAPRSRRTRPGLLLFVLERQR